MARICKHCIAKYGIRGSEVAEQDLSDDEAFYNHIEEYHGIPVKREGETEQQASDRCAAKGSVPDSAKCKCRDCREKRSY